VTHRDFVRDLVAISVAGALFLIVVCLAGGRAALALGLGLSLVIGLIVRRSA